MRNLAEQRASAASRARDVRRARQARPRVRTALARVCAGNDEADDRRSRRASVGELHIITGPMFAGKTSALMARVAAARARGERVFVITSALDVERFGERARRALVAHDGRVLEGDLGDGDLRAYEMRVRSVHGGLGDLKGADKIACEAADVVAVDEAQFMQDLVQFVRRCVEDRGQTVYVAGLDADYRRERFGNVLDLIPLCDSVTRLRGTCAECGQDSLFSRCIASNGIEGVVNVGGSDKYAPACRACYLKLSREGDRLGSPR